MLHSPSRRKNKNRYFKNGILYGRKFGTDAAIAIDTVIVPRIGVLKYTKKKSFKRKFLLSDAPRPANHATRGVKNSVKLFESGICRDTRRNIGKRICTAGQDRDPRRQNIRSLRRVVEVSAGRCW